MLFRSLRAYAAALAQAGSRQARPQPLAATVNIVAGMGSRHAELADWLAELRAAGADEFRLYHAGLASAADLAAVKDAVRALSER